MSTPAADHLGWEPIWRKYGAHGQWRKPEPLVLHLARRLKEEGAQRVHDLGCGVGRHLLVFAAAGFETYGSDISPTAIETCERRLREAGLAATLTRTDMHHIPQPDGFFDAILAWNVVYHCTTDEIVRAIAGVRDKLRDGGWFLATFLSTADGQYERARRLLTTGEARELEPDTFVLPRETATDKHLPHHYSTEREIRERFLAGFVIESLEEHRAETFDYDGQAYPTAHWRVLARKQEG